MENSNLRFECCCIFLLIWRREIVGNRSISSVFCMAMLPPGVWKVFAENWTVCGNRPIQCLAKCAARTIWQQRMSSVMPSVSRLTSGIPERQIVRNERNRNGNKQLVKNNKENNCKGRNQMEYQKRKLGKMGILTRRLWKVGHLKEFNYLF